MNLDTSGAVVGYVGHFGNSWDRLPGRYTANGNEWEIRWDDLDAFTQGYIEALFANREALLKPGRAGIFAGFSDLAPKAVTRIIADCAQFREIDRGPIYGEDHELAGRAFWAMRNSAVGVPHFPPLTVTLNDDGKVHLR